MLKELINKFYLERQKDREQHHFYVTDAGKCPRAIFFKFKKAPRAEMEPRILRMFDHGDYIHRLIMTALFSIRGVQVVASEVNIPPQEIVAGRADAVVSDGKELYVVDIKSMNGMVFNGLQKPKEEHMNQVQLYLHFLKIKKGVLLYVSKDTQELKEFLFSYDKERAERLLADFNRTKKMIEENIVPPRLPNWPKDWQCQYCQFKEICRLAGPDKINWLEFKKKIESQEEGSTQREKG